MVSPTPFPAKKPCLTEQAGALFHWVTLANVGCLIEGTAALAGGYADPNSHYLPAKEMRVEMPDHPSATPAMLSVG